MRPSTTVATTQAGRGCAIGEGAGEVVLFDEAVGGFAGDDVVVMLVRDGAGDSAGEGKQAVDAVGLGAVLGEMAVRSAEGADGIGVGAFEGVEELAGEFGVGGHGLFAFERVADGG
jgi:hypothetical protein